MTDNTIERCTTRSFLVWAVCLAGDGEFYEAWTSAGGLYAIDNEFGFGESGDGYTVLHLPRGRGAKTLVLAKGLPTVAAAKAMAQRDYARR
jgi:hypothetical protein